MHHTVLFRRKTEEQGMMLPCLNASLRVCLDCSCTSADLYCLVLEAIDPVMSMVMAFTHDEDVCFVEIFLHLLV